METGKYVISRTGSDGELPARGRKTEYYYRGMAGTICSDPAMLSISVRKNRYSYDIIKETKKFVVIWRQSSYAVQPITVVVRSGRDVDKFQEMHLTPQPSEKVKAPGIAEVRS